MGPARSRGGAPCGPAVRRRDEPHMQLAVLAAVRDRVVVVREPETGGRAARRAVDRQPGDEVVDAAIWWGRSGCEPGRDFSFLMMVAMTMSFEVAARAKAAVLPDDVGLVLVVDLGGRREGACAVRRRRCGPVIVATGFVACQLAPPFVNLNRGCCPRTRWRWGRLRPSVLPHERLPCDPRSRCPAVFFAGPQVSPPSVEVLILIRLPSPLSSH